MIQRMDRDVGRLVDLIDSRKIGGNTLIMFTSDNGPHREGGADPEFFKSSGPLRGIKRDLYEGGIRVPMVARWTGTIPAARVSYHEWAHWDILPTVTELAGAKTPAGLDGMSMVRALRGERMGDWKAVRLKKDAPLELYDLPDDPLEAHDLAAGNPDVVAKIQKYLATARTESARWPVK
jgi:arylsulfatase A-like enzyme